MERRKLASPVLSLLRQHVASAVVIACSFAVLTPAVAVAQQTLLARAVQLAPTPEAGVASVAAPAPPQPAGSGFEFSAQPADSSSRTDAATAPAPAEGLQQATLPNGQHPAPAYPDSFWGRYEARVTATQNQQPHWITPLVTVTPRLEQEFRTDFVHYHNTHGYEIWNYGNSKGLEIIPERHTELLFNVPPFFDRTNGESDGFGDISFLLKERMYSRNEQNGNAIITAFLGATLPTGKNGNGSCCATITPTLATGKGFGNFDITSTAGGSLPVTGTKTLGRSVIWNNVVQYRLAKTGVARFFWPEFEANTTFFKGGPDDGKNQVFGTPGVVIGRIPLRHDASGQPGRLGLTFGVGEEIAITRFHTANHYTVITARIPF